MMEFMTGVKKKETKEITELLTGCAEGEVVKINGLFMSFVIWEP